MAVNCMITLWHISTGEQLATQEGCWAASIFETTQVKDELDIKWDPGGYQLWRNGELAFILEDTFPGVIAFSPDQTLLAAPFGSGETGLWQVSDGAFLKELDSWNGQSSCYGGITDLAFAPNGKSLAAGCDEPGHVYLWRIADGKLLWEGAPDFNPFVTRVEFSPDGLMLASIVLGGDVLVWRAADGQLLQTLSGARVLWWVSRGGSLAFSPNGDTLTVGFPNGEVLVWRTGDGTLQRRLHDIASTGESISLSADGKFLAVGAWNSLQVWQTDVGTQLPLINRQGRRVTDSHTAPVYTSGPSGAVLDVSLSPDGKLVVATFDNWPSELKQWYLSKDGLTEAGTPELEWAQIAHSPDGRMLAGAAPTGIGVRLISDWSALTAFETDSDDPTADLTFASDSQTLALVSDYGRVLLWRAGDTKPLSSFKADGAYASSIALSPTGEQVVVGLSDTAQVFRASDGALLYTLSHPALNYPANVTDVVFSFDGQIIASSTNHGQIRLWRAEDGVLLRVLDGHRRAVISLAFSHNGYFLASGSTDGTVRLWGVHP